VTGADEQRVPVEAARGGAESHLHLGAELLWQRRFADALECFQRAHALGARGFQVYFGLGSALCATRQEAAAIVQLERAAALQPGHASALHNLAKAQYQTGLVDEAVANFRAALAVNDNFLHRSALATVIPGSPSATHADVLAARRAFVEHDMPSPRFRFSPKRTPGPLRIGYLSSFFHAPNWMKPVWGLVNAHDRTGFAVHLLSEASERECAAAGYRPNPRDTFVPIRGLDNEHAAQRIAAAELDLLVDLNGYSVLGRLPVVAYRPARTVAAWFNHFATSGMTTFDCLIGDAVVVHPEEEVYYTEKIMRVSGTYLTFDVAHAVPPVEEAPARRNRHVTFGSFASQYKLTPQVVRAWAAILDGAPDAKLLVKNRAMQEECNRVSMLQHFTDLGVDPARVTFEGGAPHYDYLASYSKIDIALDPFPHNGGTTTMEALWQGVPVLSFNGDRWAARQGASLLRAAGLDAFVARDEADYVARGVKLGREFADERMTMRARLATSSMMDTMSFAREVEGIYRRLVELEADRQP
jgi:protein O-GlcNAc transferase